MEHRIMRKQKGNANAFETRLARLQEIVTALETGEVPLEQGVALYKEGMELSRACRRQLEKARNDIRIFSEGALQPFDEESGESHDGTSDVARDDG